MAQSLDRPGRRQQISECMGARSMAHLVTTCLCWPCREWTVVVSKSWARPAHIARHPPAEDASSVGGAPSRRAQPFEAGRSGNPPSSRRDLETPTGGCGSGVRLWGCGQPCQPRSLHAVSEAYLRMGASVRAVLAAYRAGQPPWTRPPPERRRPSVPMIRQRSRGRRGASAYHCPCRSARQICF